MTDQRHTAGDAFPRFPGYRIESELGHGGMGVVYKAFQEKLERYVALKVLPERLANDRNAIDTLIREARVVADLRHPNIAVVHDIGQEGDLHYFSMEYIDGRGFDDVIVDRSVTFKEKLTILVKAAEGLEYAHSRGLIHRDIKPSNIMIDEQHRVKLMDFGLVQPEGGDGGPASGSSEFGTVGYVAPEQANGKSVDKRADVYSLGAILYDIIAFHKSSHRVNHADPNDIEAIALKSMSHAPDRRYPSAREFINDVERYLRLEPVKARPSSLVRRVVRWARRNKQLAASLGAIVFLLAGFGIYQTVQSLLERSRWRLVFADNFERTSLGKQWTTYGSLWTDTSAVKIKEAGRYWKIEGGDLVCDHRFNTFLCLNQPIVGDIRFQFDVCLPDSVNGGIYCFFLSRLEPGNKVDDQGYAVCIGAYDGTRTYVKRRSFHMVEAEDAPVPKHGRWYRVEVERNGYDMILTVDGKRVLHGHDYFPIIETGQDRLGLYSWKGRVRFDNVKIYRSTLPLKANPLKFADKLVAMGSYEEAVRQYEDIITVYPDEETALIASYKIGHAWFLARRFEQARDQFDKVMAAAGENPVRNMALVEKGMAYYYRGHEEKAREIFDRVVTELPESFYIGEIVRMFSQEVKRHMRDERNYPKVLHLLREELRYSVTRTLRRNVMGVLADIMEILMVLPGTPERMREAEALINLARTKYRESENPEYMMVLHNAVKYMQSRGRSERVHELMGEFRRLPEEKATTTRQLRNRQLYANTLMSAGRFDDARTVLEKTTENWIDEVNIPSSLIQLGGLYLHRGDTLRAEACFRRVIAEYPDLDWYNILAENLIGNLCQVRGDYERALHHYRSGAERAGDELSIERIAVENSQNVLALITGDWESVINRGVYITTTQGSYHMHFHVLCERLYLLGLVRWHLGKPKQKDLFFKTILQMYRYQPFVLMAQMGLDRITEAEYLDRMKDYPVEYKDRLYFGLAEYFFLKGQKLKARHYYQRVIELADCFIGIDPYHLQGANAYYRMAVKRVEQLGASR